MEHLRFSGLTADEQKCALFDIIADSPLLMAALEKAHELNLPDWYIVSGALYNLVWNVLTGRPESHGIKDIDLFYFDDADLSYEAEDHFIKAGAQLFADLSVPVEIRNQARVHLWFERHFGEPYSPLQSSEEGIDRFASKTHALGIRLEPNGHFKLYAPYGLDDVFSFKISPNYGINNRATHHAKGLRAQQNWPEVTVVPWDELSARNCN